MTARSCRFILWFSRRPTLFAVIVFLLAWIAVMPLAHAEAAVVPPARAVDWTQVLIALIGALAVPLLGMLSALLLKVIPSLVQTAKDKSAIAGSEKINAVKNRLLDLVGMVVSETTQTTVDSLKASFAKGVLSKSDLETALAKAKTDALAKIMSHATATGLMGDLQAVFGDQAAVAAFTASALEATVGAQKAAAASPK